MKKQPKKKPPKTPVTPGPYRLSDEGCGYSVRGVHDVSMAWFGTSMIVGISGSHRVTIEEAHANATLFLKALEANALAAAVSNATEELRVKP